MSKPIVAPRVQPEAEHPLREPTAKAKPRSGHELLQALEELGFIGMWADRTDIDDSVQFARQLRREAWTRGRDA